MRFPWCCCVYGSCFERRERVRAQRLPRRDCASATAETSRARVSAVHKLDARRLRDLLPLLHLARLQLLLPAATVVDLLPLSVLGSSELRACAPSPGPGTRTVVAA